MWGMSKECLQSCVRQTDVQNVYLNSINKESASLKFIKYASMQSTIPAAHIPCVIIELIWSFLKLISLVQKSNKWQDYLLCMHYFRRNTIRTVQIRLFLGQTL